MHIIQEIREAIGWVVKQVLLIAGVVVVVTIAPIILAVLPQVLIIDNPHGDFSGLGQLFFWATPLSVFLWMAFLWGFLSRWAMERRGMGTSEWRDANGGFIGVQVKSTGYAILGFFGSFACEFLFIFIFRIVPYSMFNGAFRYSLWFALFPFAAYTPVILLLLKHRSESKLFVSPDQWAAYLEQRRVQAERQAARDEAWEQMTHRDESELLEGIDKQIARMKRSPI